MSLLCVEKVSRRFGGVVAVDGASLAVPEATITGLIGPNGAGKTTIFNIVSGLVPPDEGQVRFGGQDITGWRPDRISRHGLVRSFQIARGFPRLTVLENLMVYGRPQPGEAIHQAWWPRSAPQVAERDLLRRAESVAGRLMLDRILDQRADEISGGQKKLLEIGRVLMAGPRLMLLDEPIAGVNPTLAKQIAALLHSLRQEGLTILVIEHNMDLIASTCDPVIVMAQGRELATGRFAEVAADRRVQDAYMGRRH